MEDKMIPKKLPIMEYIIPTDIQKDNNNQIHITGKLQTADKPNANNRIYPKHILEREINNFMEKIRNRTTEALGELDHPVSTPIKDDQGNIIYSLYEQITINNASHFIEDLHWEGDDIYGRLLVLDEGKGKILRDLVEKKIKVGISSRALGNVIKNQEGYDIVQEDLELITWDVVSTPSTFNAFVLAEQRIRNLYMNYHSNDSTGNIIERNNKQYDNKEIWNNITNDIVENLDNILVKMLNY